MFYTHSHTWFPLVCNLLFYQLLYYAVLTFAVEDLNLNAVESLKGIPYLAIGKHLCGPATGNQNIALFYLAPKH